MNPPEKLDPRMLETLSAYLDGTLAGAEKTVLEARLKKEENLRGELAELRAVRDSLRSLPLLKPPRALALTPNMAGKSAGTSAVHFTRWMALGSALATLAFVCVLGVDAFERGTFVLGAGASRAMSANQALAGPEHAEDQTGEEKSGAAQPTAAPASLATMAPAANQTAAAPGCENCEPTGMPSGTQSPAPLLGGGCGGCSATEARATNPPQTASLPSAAAPRAYQLPDFQTAAPFVEGFLALSAVLLAAAAGLTLWAQRRNHPREKR